MTDLQSKNKKCLRVQPGDRLGIYSEYEMSSMCYRFTTDPARVEMMVKAFQNVTHPVADSHEQVLFENVVYPYDFFAEAYFYYGKKLFVSLMF